MKTKPTASCHILMSLLIILTIALPPRSEITENIMNGVITYTPLPIALIPSYPSSEIDVYTKPKVIEEKTKNNNEHFLYIAVGYGGREEIVDAVKKLINKVLKGEIKPDSINEETLSKLLYTGDLPKPDPDLIIRTSGEERLSGFLLWQSAYSELYFCDVHWPSFRKIDFWRAIRSYQRRERRFGS